jgi:outer membrane protein assembly factor BamB
VDGDVVYVLGSFGDLASLATADGTVRWQLNLKETFGSEQPGWGFSTSPLVDDDLLVVEGGGAEGKSYAGLEKSSGKVRWTVGDAEGGPGYNSAIPVTMNGARRFVYVAGSHLRCIDPEGKVVWDHQWPRGETHAVPVFIAPNMIFASGAQGVGAQLLRINEDGDKAVVEELWQSDGMKNHFNASVVTDGVIFGFDNATLKAISVETGEPLWAKRGLGKGSLILADGNLVVLSDRGKLLLVEASGEAFVEKSSVQAIEGRSWTAPTLAGGRLYLRNHSEMVAYDLRGEG